MCSEGRFISLGGVTEALDLLGLYDILNEVFIFILSSVCSWVSDVSRWKQNRSCNIKKTWTQYINWNSTSQTVSSLEEETVIFLNRLIDTDYLFSCCLLLSWSRLVICSRHRLFHLNTVPLCAGAVEAWSRTRFLLYVELASKPLNWTRDIKHGDEFGLTRYVLRLSICNPPVPPLTVCPAAASCVLSAHTYVIMKQYNQYFLK